MKILGILHDFRIFYQILRKVGKIPALLLQNYHILLENEWNAPTIHACLLIPGINTNYAAAWIIVSYINTRDRGAEVSMGSIVPLSKLWVGVLCLALPFLGQKFEKKLNFQHDHGSNIILLLLVLQLLVYNTFLRVFSKFKCGSPVSPLCALAISQIKSSLGTTHLPDTCVTLSSTKIKRLHIALKRPDRPFDKQLISSKLSLDGSSPVCKYCWIIVSCLRENVPPLFLTCFWSDDIFLQLLPTVGLTNQGQEATRSVKNRQEATRSNKKRQEQ